MLMLHWLHSLRHGSIELAAGLKLAASGMCCALCSYSSHIRKVPQTVSLWATGVVGRTSGLATCVLHGLGTKLQVLRHVLMGLTLWQTEQGGWTKSSSSWCWMLHRKQAQGAKPQGRGSQGLKLIFYAFTCPLSCPSPLFCLAPWPQCHHDRLIVRRQQFASAFNA